MSERKRTRWSSPRVLGYLRVSTNEQELENQRHEINDYAQKRALLVDEFIGVEMSSKRNSKERRIDELLEKTKSGDRVIVSELSRLGRSTLEVLALINELAQRGIELSVVKQNLELNGQNDMMTKAMVTLFSLFAELERDLLSSRTKQALARRRAQGAPLGRPKGPGKSKLDEKKEEIMRLLDKKVSIASLAKIYDCTWPTMANFIKKINAKHEMTRRRRMD